MPEVRRGPQEAGGRGQTDSGQAAAAVLQRGGVAFRPVDRRSGSGRCLPDSTVATTRLRTVLPTAAGAGRPTAAVLLSAAAAASKTAVGTAAAGPAPATAAPAPTVAATPVAAATAAATVATAIGGRRGLLPTAAAATAVQRLLPTAVAAAAVAVAATATATVLPTETAVQASRHTSERADRRGPGSAAAAAGRFVPTGWPTERAGGVRATGSGESVGSPLLFGRRRVQVPVFR